LSNFFYLFPNEIKTQMTLFAYHTQWNSQEGYYLGFTDAVN